MAPPATDATLSRTARAVFAVSAAAFVATLAVLCAAVLSSTWTAQAFAQRARAVSALTDAPQWQQAAAPPSAALRDAVHELAARAAGTLVPSFFPASIPLMLQTPFALDIGGMAVAAISLEPLVMTTVRNELASNAVDLTAFNAVADTWNATRAVLEKLVGLSKNPCVPEPDLGVLNQLYAQPFNFIVNNLVAADIRGLGVNGDKFVRDLNRTAWFASPQAGAGMAGGVQSALNTMAALQLVYFNPILPTSCSACPAGQVLCPNGACAASLGACPQPAVPAVASVTPSFGAVSGGASITIGFSGLSAAPVIESVRIGGLVAAVSTAATQTSVVVTLPAYYDTGAVSVLVQTSNFGPLVRPNSFTYFGAPSIGGFAPTSGGRAGGFYVTIYGTNLGQPITGVSFAGVPGTVTARINGSVVAQVGASGTAGSGVVSLTTALFGVVNSTGTFTYNVETSVSSVTPASVSAGAQATLTIAGTGFSSPINVAIGTTLVTVSSSTSTSIVVTYTPSFPGVVSVFVRTGSNGFVTLPNSLTVTASPPTLTSAQFTNTLNAIVLQFSQPLTPLSSTSCATYVANANTLFGSSAICVFASLSQIAVFGMPSTATVAIGSTIALQTNAVFAFGSSTVAATGSVSVLAPAANSMAGFIAAPDTLTSCAPLLLNAFVFSGTGGRSVTYAWSASPSVTAINTALSAATTGSVTIAAADIPTGTALTFSCTVTNFIGQSTVLTSSAVTRASLPLPDVSIAGPSSVTTVASRFQAALAFVSIPSCATYTSVGFTWSAIAGTPANSFTSTRSLLVLPAYTLPVTSASPATYTFRVSAAASTNSTLTATATVSFVVTPVPPIVIVAAPSQINIGEGDAVGLDASLSVNLNNQNALSCAWSCASLVGAECPPQPFQSASSCTTSLLGALSAGVYSISVAVTDSLTTQSASKTLTVNVTASGPIQCLIAQPGYILPGTNVILRAVAAAGVSFRWDGASSLFAAGSLLSSRLGPFVVFNGASLVASSSYTVTLACTSGVRSGASSTTITVVTPPSSGSCSCSATSVAALTDTLTCSCTGFQSANTPLQYQFQGVDTAGNIVVLSELTAQSSISTSLGNPASGNTLSIQTIIQDSVGARTTYTWTSTVTVTQASNLAAALVAGTDSITAAVNTGNLGQAASSLLATASVINRFGSSVTNSATVRATLATQLLTFTASIQTQSFLSQVSSSLSQVCGVASLPSGVVTSGLSAIDSVLSSLSSNSALSMDSSTATNIIGSLGNIFSSLGSARSLASARSVVSARTSLLATLRAQISTLVCGQNAATSTGSSLDTAIQTIVQTSFDSLGVSLGATASVTLPSNMGSTLGISSTTCANYFAVRYSTNPFAAPSAGTLATNVVELFVETTGGSPINPGTLSSNMQVVLPTPTAIDTNANLVTCIQYSSGSSAWVASGCTVVSTTATAVTCSCNSVAPTAATTSARSGSGSTTGLAAWIIAVIVVGSVLFVATIVAIVFCVRACRKRTGKAEQKTKARGKHDVEQVSPPLQGAVPVQYASSHQPPY